MGSNDDWGANSGGGGGNSGGSGWGRGGGGGGNITDVKRQPLPVLSMFDIKSIPLLDSGKTLLGRMVFTSLTRPAVYFNDAIDRLNCYVVPAVLMFFIAIISANVFGLVAGEPIRCLKTPELNDEERTYAVDYCQSKNQYFVSPDEGIPWSDKERRQRELGYYHWVPVTLFLQAMLFCLPNMLWNSMNTLSGVDYTTYITEAVRLRDLPLSDPQRASVSETLAKHIFEALIEPPNRGRLFGWLFGRHLGFYVAVLYTFIKLLYLLNVAVQFLALNAFIGHSYTYWGIEVLRSLLTGENWQDSPVFPRLTLCDVPIRRLGDVPRYTLQCHLRVNTYNEKIYLFIWWGFLVVAMFTAINFLYYLLTFLAPWNCERSIRHLLKDKRHRALVYDEDKRSRKLIRKFAERGMRRDGVLLFWFIEGHAGAAVARELCGNIFEEYRNQVAIEPASPSLTYSEKSTMKLRKGDKLSPIYEGLESGPGTEVGFKKSLLDQPDNAAAESSSSSSSSNENADWGQPAQNVYAPPPNAPANETVDGWGAPTAPKKGDLEQGLPMPQYPLPPAPASSPTQTRRGPLGFFSKRGGKNAGFSTKGSKDV